MNTFNTQATVGELVVENPTRARVFEKLGIDYCCGGKKPLADACAEQGLDVGRVTEALATADAPGEGQRDWSQARLTELCDHIEATHHAYLKQELPRLTAMIQKVAQVHGDRHAELWMVRDVFEGMRSEMEAHMFKEEHILFPAIRRLESNSGEPCFHCGSIQNPIRVMESEHDSAGGALERMRQLTQGYAVPDGACNTYRAMLSALEQLEADMHQHVHKENNVLFPRAIAAEAGH